jgi:hypothetical protein
VRAARLLTLNVPKPTKVTVSPFLRVFLTASMMEASARVAAALEMSDFVAMCSISSVLFTVLFLLLIWLPAMLIWAVYLNYLKNKYANWRTQ